MAHYVAFCFGVAVGMWVSNILRRRWKSEPVKVRGTFPKYSGEP